MATYYRWRKSGINYIETTGEDKNFYFVFGGLTLWYSDSKPDIVPNSAGYGQYHFDKSMVISSSNSPSVSGLFFGSRQNTSGMYKGNTNARAAVYTDDFGDQTIQIIGSAVSYKIDEERGDEIGYVYSTNSNSYSNGGITKGYWYDQRTTVTSPTAPSNISAPNPIITPNVTVSWSAATSNVPDYPVNLYELSYSVNGGSSWTVAGTTAGTSLEVDIPFVATSILFRVRARDSNSQWGSYSTSSTAIPVYLAPTLTVPQMLMQGQQATINWTAIEGADSYTLQRKANTDTDWVQVYSGTALTYSETAGIWTSVQYRVQAAFDGTPGGWATSAEIPVVSASALVISGQDGDLGTLVNDVPYSISSDQTSPTIDVTVEVNGGEYASFQATSGQTYTIGVLDLPTGTGAIVITASTEVSSSPVTVTRTWTYSKTAQTFSNAGGVARLTKEGAVIWPKTLDEAVRAAMNPWGGNLGTALNILKNAALFNRTKQPKYSEVTISMANVTEEQIVNIPRGGVMTPHYVAKLEYESGLNGAGRRLLVPVECYDQRQWNSTNVNAYATSDIDTWMNSTYKALFPEEIQTAMGTTRFYYTPGNGNNTVTTLERSLFLMSLTELGESHSDANVEGSALPIASTLRIAYHNGSATNQWTRSPGVYSTRFAWKLYSNGDINTSAANNSDGSRPCLTLPSTFTRTYFVDQQGGIHDSQEYEEAGTWSDVWGNEIPAVKIYTGSYVGTGTSGENNPNTLTFPFEPKAVFVCESFATDTGNPDTILYFGQPGSTGSAEFSVSGNTFEWFSTSASHQLNNSGETYYYVAIG